jgi:hypothetical protein
MTSRFVSSVVGSARAAALLSAMFLPLFASFFLAGVPSGARLALVLTSPSGTRLFPFDESSGVIRAFPSESLSIKADGWRGDAPRLIVFGREVSLRSFGMGSFSSAPAPIPDGMFSGDVRLLVMDGFATAARLAVDASPGALPSVRATIGSSARSDVAFADSIGFLVDVEASGGFAVVRLSVSEASPGSCGSFAGSWNGTTPDAARSDWARWTSGPEGSPDARFGESFSVSISASLLPFSDCPSRVRFDATDRFGRTSSAFAETSFPSSRSAFEASARAELGGLFSSNGPVSSIERGKALVTLAESSETLSSASSLALGYAGRAAVSAPFGAPSAELWTLVSEASRSASDGLFSERRRFLRAMRASAEARFSGSSEAEIRSLDAESERTLRSCAGISPSVGGACPSWFSASAAKAFASGSPFSLSRAERLLSEACSSSSDCESPKGE